MRRSGPRVSFKGHADSDEEYHSRSPVSPREIPDSQPGSPNHDFDELQNSNPVLPREIPDSQPDTSSHGFDGAEEPDDSVSFKTEATVVIPGGTQLTPKPEPRYPLHTKSINRNGRLPCEATKYSGDMDEEPTQPATQPYIDPRRQGIISILDLQDESDVICMLYPTSRSAHDAVQLTAEVAAQHIKQNHDMSQIDEEGDGVMSEASKTRDDRSQDSDLENKQSHDSAKVKDLSNGVGKACDLALRFSSRVHNLCHGFVFGRNPKTCDLLLCDYQNKQVSNKHFRIYVNSHGVLMLEDTSTNGTIVDGTLLRGSKGKATDRNLQPRRTLTDGDHITLPTITRTNGESVRFIVKMPSRDKHQKKYEQSLATYLACVEQAERQAAATTEAAMKGLPMNTPQTIKTMQQPLQQGTTPNGSILTAATGQTHHGMHWNGGDKYNVICYIGKGAFAMVYKLSSKQDGEVFAVKEIDKAKIKDRNEANKARKELDVIKNLRHPNIVKYIDHLDSPGYLYIIMEFVPFGDLRVYTDAGSAMPEYICVHLAGQITGALKYLHDRKIVHRDIKPDNLLMFADDPYSFKLSDFGLSKMVTNGEYLQTFCGTLLYCAPEIYPGYSKVKMGLPVFGKRTRANERLSHQPQRYENSVDTWSFGAVLYHLLCGAAPFPGSLETAMLINVMTTSIDWERLKQAGITSGGIDFVQNMLVTEPSQRASDQVLLDHPWLLSAPDRPDLEENQPPVLDASQLSLADNEEVQDDGLDYIDETADPREPKRIRGWPQNDGSGDMIGGSQFDMTGLAPGMSYPPAPQRLFGEIGSSALRSSGVLGQTAHAALTVPSGGSYDPSAFHIQGHNGGSYDPATFGIPDGGSYDPATFGIPGGGNYYPSSASGSYADPGFGQASRAEDVSYIDPHYVLNHPTNEGVTQQNVQYPQLLTGAGAGYINGAPSLLGAEALVRQLNMASPESGVSGPSEDSKPASPKTPHSRELSPTTPGSKRASQGRRSAQAEANAKRSKTSHTPSSPSTRRQSGETYPQVPQHISQVGGQTRDLAATPHEGATRLGRSNNASQSSDSDDHQDGQQSRKRIKSNTTLPPTAFNSQDSAHDSNGGDKASSKPTSRRQSTSSNTANNAPPRRASQTNQPPAPTISLTRPSSSGTGPTIAIADTNPFGKPEMLFGNLVIVKGSIPSHNKIRIQAQKTTYGRALDSTYIHKDSKDDRIPKNAIDLQMWYPNIADDVTAGKDWSNRKDIRAIISTRTNRYIKINGIRLMKGTDCYLYGELKSGDLISIFELSEGRKAVTKEDREFLHYRCEFYVGASRDTRKEDEPFFVKRDEVGFKENIARKSRESTEAVDLIPTPGNGKGKATSGTAAKNKT